MHTYDTDTPTPKPGRGTWGNDEEEGNEKTATTTKCGEGPGDTGLTSYQLAWDHVCK